MKIATLVEDTSISKKYQSEHGLSFYIETKKHKLLFDLGATSLFHENARKMNIDLAAVDTVIISHGHYDHGGGLKRFLKINKKAKIYLHSQAFEKHFSKRSEDILADIGLDVDLIPNDRFVFLYDNIKLDNELEIFTNVKQTEQMPSNNLYKEVFANYIQDDFAHEIYLIVHENDNNILFTGCSHNGIINIVDHLKNIRKLIPDVLIGGFHLSQVKLNDYRKLEEIGKQLNNGHTEYYTCHCTGKSAYMALKKELGAKIDYLQTGSRLEIN